MLNNPTISAHQPAVNSSSRQTSNVATIQQSSQITQSENTVLATDTVTLSYSSESVTTYNSSMSLQGTKGDGFDLMRGLVLNMLKEQGIDYKISTGDTQIDISKITPEEAQALVADDGYFGVDKTSQRIFDLAVGIAGGDASKIDAVRSGIEKGFKEAYKAMGDWLPDISCKTYDAVMQKLDDWAGSNSSQQSND